MMEILIYAAIAAFLAYRLWSVLGQREEGDDKSSQRPNPFASQEKSAKADDDVMVIEGRARPALPSPLTPFGHAPTSLAGAIDRIKQADDGFNEKQFLEGAKMAFQSIVASFAAGDLSKVARWLGPAVRTPFEKAMAETKARGEVLENKVERIVAADIVKAALEGSLATLSVEFVSYQVNVLRNAAGEILDGKPGQSEEVRDLWTFSRDLKSGDPNWVLVETRS